MKTKIILALMALSLSIFGLMSCTEDNESVVPAMSNNTITNSVQVQLVNPYDYLGEIHNKAMEEVFQQLLPYYQSGEFTSTSNYEDDNFNSKVLTIITGALNNQSLNVSEQEVDDFLISNGFKTAVNELNTGYFLTSSLRETIYGCTSEKDANMVVYIFDELRNIIEGEEMFTLASIANRIQAVESKILQETWDEEETMALKTIAIVKHSYEFNVSKLLGAKEQNVVSKKIGKTEAAVAACAVGTVLADAAGAIAGGVCTGGIGALPGAAAASGSSAVVVTNAVVCGVAAAGKYLFGWWD